MSCIVANSTGVGAISLIRVSGCNAFEVVQRLCGGKRMENIPARTATLIKLAHNGRVLDTVLLTKFVAPASFTGENMVEISCHGGRFVPASIVSALIDSGSRLAEAGEFSKRAYLNGKLSLTEAEGVVDLINAETEAQARAAQQLIDGELTKRVGREYQILMDILAHIEASLDYPDEDLDPINYPKTHAEVLGVKERLEGLAGSYSTGRAVKEGFRVVLSGVPNAGKSSLFNYLTGSNAIVTSIAGTTTDTKTEPVVLNGCKVLFTDTAGLRTATGEIEQLGVELAKKEIVSADLVLRIVDATRLVGEELSHCTKLGFDNCLGVDEENVFTVYTKMDLVGEMEQKPVQGDVFFVSSVSGEGTDRLMRAIESRASVKDFCLTNLRHYQAITQAVGALANALVDFHSRSGDLLAVDIRAALEHLGKITGSSASTDLLNTIFSKFCLGK